jgi:hypothetical protein
MMRDVGVDIDPDADLSEKDNVRRAADIENRTNIRNVLNDKRIPFTEQSSLVLAQPERDLDPDLYWKSIEDFLIFIKKIADARSMIPGRVLCDLFDEAKPHIMQINDFNNPKVQFDAILMNYVTRQLKAAQAFATKDVHAVVKSEIGQWPTAKLRQRVPPDFLQRQIRETQGKFTSKANELYPHVLDLYSAKARQVEDEIDLTVKQSCNTAFIDACAQKLVPECKTSVLRDVEAAIGREMAELATEDVGAYSFAHTTGRFQQRAKSQLTSQLTSVDQVIIERPEFSSAVDELSADVLGSLNRWEQRKKKDLEQYQREQREASERQLTATMRAEQEKLKRELTADEEKRIRAAQERADRQVKTTRQEAAKVRLAAEQKQKELQGMIEQQKSGMEAAERVFQTTTAKLEQEARVMREERERRDREHNAAMASLRFDCNQQISAVRAECDRRTSGRRSGTICNVC